MTSKYHYTVINISETTQFTKMRHGEIHRGNDCFSNRRIESIHNKFSLPLPERSATGRLTGKFSTLQNFTPRKHNVSTSDTIEPNLHVIGPAVFLIESESALPWNPRRVNGGQRTPLLMFVLIESSQNESRAPSHQCSTNECRRPVEAP